MDKRAWRKAGKFSRPILIFTVSERREGDVLYNRVCRRTAVVCVELMGQRGVRDLEVFAFRRKASCDYSGYFFSDASYGIV